MPDNTKGLDNFFFSLKENDIESLKSFMGDVDPSKTSIDNYYGLPTKNYDEFGNYDQFVTPNANLESIRSTYQGTTRELANGLGRAALNVVPSIIGNVASIVDIEDYLNQDKEVGNAVTKYMEEIKASNNEMLPIYGEKQLNSLDMGESEWWTSNFSNLAESAASFALTGAGLGYGVKGLGFLGKIAGASANVQKAIQVGGGVTTALALNQAEAITSAMDVYEKSLDYQKNILGKSEDEAQQIAADAAAYTININRLNLPLNITSTLAFLRTSPMTRQAIQQAGLKSASAKVMEEGLQEAGEELINKVAEDEGNRYGKIGKEYNYNIDNTISDIFSKEGLEAGLLGALGGMAQTGLSEASNHLTGNYDEQNKLYSKQQSSLNQLEQFSNSPKLKDVISNLKTQASLINDINDAQAQGDETKVQALKSDLLINQAVSSFDAGTTDRLEEMYSTISKTPQEEGEQKYGKDFKENANKAVSQIRQWEHDWDKFMQTVPDKYNKKELFINKLQQKELSNKINELKHQEAKLTSEVETIKQSSEEGVTIPQEIELKGIQDKIVKHQEHLSYIQEKSHQILNPSKFVFKKETPRQEQGSREIKEEVQQTEFVESEFQKVDTKNEDDEALDALNNILSTKKDNLVKNGMSEQEAKDLAWKEFPDSDKVSYLTLHHKKQGLPLKEAVTKAKERVQSGKQTVNESEEQVVENANDSHDIVNEIIESNDIFSSKKSKDDVDKFIDKESSEFIKKKTRATERFTNLLIKKGIDIKKFNPAMVEKMFNDAGQSEYFQANKNSILEMVDVIQTFTGSRTPLSYDSNIPPNNINEEKFGEEPSGLKRTSSLNGRYKVVETDERGGTKYDANGNVVFEKTNEYDVLHTNKVLIGDELEFELNNADTDTGLADDDGLDSLVIRVVDAKTKELRFYVSTIKSINQDSMDLSEAELELEKNKVREIRKYFNENRTGRMKSTISSTTIGKLEWNKKAKSIGSIPNVQRYLHVKSGAELKGQSVPQWAYNFPNQEWFDDIHSGSVLLVLPEDNHSQSSGPNSKFSRPVPLSPDTFRDNGSSTLLEIRNNIKAELEKFLSTGKCDFKMLHKWMYLQSTTIDPAQLGKRGLQLRNENGKIDIVFNGGSYTNSSDLDSILDNLRVNINAKELSNPDSDYTTKLINSGVLKTRLAFKETKEGPIFAFHPSYIYGVPVPISDNVETFTQETTQDTGKKNVHIDFNEEDDDDKFDISVNPNSIDNINPELTLNQEDKLRDSFAYLIVKGETKESIRKDLTTAMESLNPEKFPKKIKLFKNTLDSFDEYFNRAKQLLDSLDFNENDYGIFSDTSDEEGINQMVEESGFLEIREESVPKNVRKFLMYIPAYEDGKVKRNSLGLKTFNSISDTYLKLAQYLSTEDYDNTLASYNKMITALQGHPSPVLQEVGKLLIESKNEQLHNQFYRAFNQLLIDSRTFLLTEKDNGFSVSIARADKSAAFHQLKQEWYVDFKSMFLVDKNVDVSKGEKLLERFNSLMSHNLTFTGGKAKGQMNPTAVNMLKDILHDMGAKISTEGLNSWLTNDSNYNRSKERNDKEHLNNTLKYVFIDLAGKGDKNTVSEDNEVVTKNNPFENEARHIESLAKHESRFSKIQGGSSFRHDGKQYSSFVRHMPLDKVLSKFKSMKDDLLDYPVFKHSYYVQKLQEVSFIVERGLRINKKGAKNKNFKDANETEHEVIKMLAFQKSGVIKSDTLSDKTTNIFFNVPVHKTTLVDGQLGLDTKKLLLRYFKMEYDRVLLVNKRSKEENQDFMTGYDSTSTKKGAGEYFLDYDFLNYEVLGDSPEEQFVKKYLYDESGRIIDIGLYKDPEKVEEVITRLIVKRVDSIGKSVRKDWEKLGIFSYNKSKNELYINDIEKNYRADVIKRLQDSGLETHNLNILNLAVKDYVINTMVQSIEMHWIFGDPALQTKIKYPKNSDTLTKDQLIKGIKDTFDNVGKRNASLMAQAEGGKWKRPTYNVAFVNDIGVNASNLEQYHLDFSDAYADKKNEKMTDAQELTTVWEHLEDRFSNGDISKELMFLGLMYFDPQAYNSKEFEKAFPERPEFKKELTDVEIRSLNGILQPRKPVQVFNTFTKEKLPIKYYIKTSSVPLVQTMVKGTPMEKVLKAMKANNVQRVAFNSGVKIGQNNAQEIFKDGEVNPDLFKTGVNTLHRSGYGIQLSVPYDESKDAIRQVTQAMKLLFVDLKDSMVLSNGMTVKEARERYVKIEEELVKKGKDKLLEELGASGNTLTKMSKLSSILTREGEDRGYTQNALAGLKTINGKFKIPLTYSPNIGQIQPVLMSLFNNKIIRQKITGKSYVQASEILSFNPKKGGVKSLDKLSKDVRNSITWLSKEHEESGKLRFIDKGESQSSPAEVLVSSFLVGMDGKKLDLRKYVTPEGYLDTTKIDPSILEMHGFRIPNQAHSSMMHFKVVGFLPEGMGDTIIVPSEIAIQMGSDYDVDKLYAYHYEFEEGENGLFKKQSLINDLIDIHKAVILTNDMFDTVTKPQGFEDLADSIKEINKLLPQEGEWLGAYNPIYQRKQYFDNSAGKTGVGVASNHNTQHALSQQANLYIQDQGILFKRNDGTYFNEEVETNRVNDYTTDLYSYENSKGKVSMEERNDSAWRLDKVYTYSGKLISQVIAEWQGASVDNAKEKLLGLGGINGHNLSVSLLIARAGFDNEWILNFINQPILKEYYSTIDDLSSVFYDSFESDRRQKAIEALYVKAGIKDIKLFNQAPIEGYTLGEYTDMIKENNPYTSKQAEILKAFLKYETIATNLASLQSRTNIDVKGLPKNYIETVELSKKQTKLNSLGLGNTHKLYDTVISSFLDIPAFASELFSEVFDYATPAYTKVLEELRTQQRVEDFSTDQLNKIYNNLYSFVYTIPSIQEAIADGRNIDEYRKSLVIGENTLSDRLQVLKEKYPDNMLLSRVSRISDDNNKDIKRLQLDATYTKTESYDKELTASWLDIIRNNQPDQELKQLGLDLVAYAMFFNNEPYGTSNFMKYVPIEYFEAIGFGDKLREMHDKLENADFLKNFIRQYYQHNPTETISATFINNLKENEVKKGKLWFTLNEESAGRLVIYRDPENPFNVVYADYVRVYNTETSQTDLYEKASQGTDTVSYVKIDQLGENSFNEYSFNNIKQTTLLSSKKVAENEYNKNVIESLAEVKVEEPQGPIQEESFDITSYFESNGTKLSKPKEVLKNIIARASLKDYNNFYLLGKMLEDVPLDYTIEYTDIKNKNVHASTNGKTIKLDLKKLKKYSEYEVQRIVLHEYIHALTKNKLANKAFQKTEEYNNLVKVWEKYKRSLGENIDEAKDFKKRVEKNKETGEDTFSDLKNFSEMKSKYYAYADLDEFVTQCMTDSGFQAYLNSVDGGKSTLWEKFKKAIKDIIASVTGSGLLDEAVDSVMEVINHTNVKPSSTKSSNDFGMTVAEVMKEMTPEQRAKFRELKEKGIFTTKCN